jgi:hypothetical protein
MRFAKRARGVQALPGFFYEKRQMKNGKRTEKGR